ncbi:unnamed protein product [Microthlaspi erraticum]|uniref:Uncharacterized protein n=1 Tax=Microthlaspi erraticum TaxID=1685480 RepID=A0A6D2JVE3_9BRAS|nr:unnamed protein product [Microthlaspi erraticum]
MPHSVFSHLILNLIPPHSAGRLIALISPFVHATASSTRHESCRLRFLRRRLAKSIAPKWISAARRNETRIRFSAISQPRSAKQKVLTQHEAKQSLLNGSNSRRPPATVSPFSAVSKTLRKTIGDPTTRINCPHSPPSCRLSPIIQMHARPSIFRKEIIYLSSSHLKKAVPFEIHSASFLCLLENSNQFVTPTSDSNSSSMPLK